MKRFKTLITNSSLLVVTCWLGLLSPLHAFAQRADSGTLYPVYRNGKWGYYDRNGKVVIEPRFEYALNFTHGLALVAVGRTKTDWPHPGLTIWRVRYIGKQGYIDHTGKFVSDKLSWKSK